MIQVYTTNGTRVLLQYMQGSRQGAGEEKRRRTNAHVPVGRVYKVVDSKGEKKNITYHHVHSYQPEQARGVKVVPTCSTAAFGLHHGIMPNDTEAALITPEKLDSAS